MNPYSTPAIPTSQEEPDRLFHPWIFRTHTIFLILWLIGHVVLGLVDSNEFVMKYNFTPVSLFFRIFQITLLTQTMCFGWIALRTKQPLMGFAVIVNLGYTFVPNLLLDTGLLLRFQPDKLTLGTMAAVMQGIKSFAIYRTTATVERSILFKQWSIVSFLFHFLGILLAINRLPGFEAYRLPALISLSSTCLVVIWLVILQFAAFWTIKDTEILRKVPTPVS